MRRSLFSIVTGTALLASAGSASADTTTTTTWSPEMGTTIREYSTTHHYSSFEDPSLQAGVGTVVPEAVTVYPLPQGVTVTQPEQYSYSIINEHPVVIERSTRRVIHTW